MQGPGLPSLVSCYEDQSCMTTTTPSRPQYCTPTPQNNYHSGRVLQEMMQYQNEVNFPGFIADHRGSQSLQSSWTSPWGTRQNVPYLAHPHPGIYILYSLTTCISYYRLIVSRNFTNPSEIIDG